MEAHLLSENYVPFWKWFKTESIKGVKDFQTFSSENTFTEAAN